MACPLFVHLVEYGYTERENKITRLAAEEYLEPIRQAQVDTLILGCTHYPYHLEVLQETVEFLRNYKRDGVYIYRNVIAADFKFIDPAQYTAMECYTLLRESGELAYRVEKGALYPYISIPAYGLPVENVDKNGDLTYDFKYGREVGTEDVTTKVVPFSSRYIDQSTIDRMARLVPESYEMFKERL